MKMIRILLFIMSFVILPSIGYGQSAKEASLALKKIEAKVSVGNSLFFGHLTIEKILKAIYVDKLNGNPPYTHRLVNLAEKISLGLTEEQLELLEIITDFNMEARYPDEKFSFKKKCTRNFSKK